MLPPSQMLQMLLQTLAHPALPAPSAQSPAVVTLSNFRGYARPVTVIQSVSTEEIDPSSQIQAREEEIELLHAQLECFQQVSFPEYVLSNPQIIAPSVSSLGATCMKHLHTNFC